MSSKVILGEKYGSLTILEDLGMILQKSGKKRHFVKCQCDCGKIKNINWYDLKNNKIQSCGCFFTKMMSERGKLNKRGNPKHNLYYTDIYKKYHQVKGECYNPNNKKYKNFGGRGIKLSEEWLGEKGFINFYNWSLSSKFGENNKKSLCRKNLDYDFCPENCFWETLSYAKKNCQSDISLKNAKALGDEWRKNNYDKILEYIGKGMKTKILKYGKIAPNREKCSWKQGWREIGGKKKYFRSLWEANYARYLEFLKQHNQIKDWEHEPDTFWFNNIKRGCRSYLPDFKIINNNGSIEYHEVKGWYDERSKTKIKRMAKYYPDVKLIVIFAKQYYLIANQVKNLIKDWE